MIKINIIKKIIIKINITLIIIFEHNNIQYITQLSITNHTLPETCALLNDGLQRSFRGLTKE